MSKTVCHGYAAHTACQHLKNWHYVLPKPVKKQITIAIDYCGVCHSDLDILDNTWKDTQYPMIPGHEIIGHVIDIGEAVTQFQIGDRVGCSWQQGHCGQCHYCQSNQTEYCPTLSAIGINHQGGFADKIQAHEAYICKIPNALHSASAAPLLCAGATVFNAIKTLQVNAHHRVGVIGVGGLGHLAIQFLAKLNCEITAFDPDISKTQDCLRFGATQLIDSKTPSFAPTLLDSFDYLLVTADTTINLSRYIPLLRAKGTLCFAGMPKKNMQLPLFSMIIGAKTITAVNIGNPENVAKTLTFAARHQIHAEVELWPLKRVNDAIEKLREHKPRYRIVLEHNKHETSEFDTL